MVKWENMIFEWPFGQRHQAEHVRAKLDEFGEQGWELVTIVGRTPGPSLFFKRPKAAE